MQSNTYSSGLVIDPEAGLVAPARQCPSPNRDDRPQSMQLDLIVVHSISLPPGEFGGPSIDALFRNRLDSSADPYFREIADLKVSAHCLIRRDGELVQYVPFHQRAWHAGVSSFNGRERCNDFSVGIELEGTDSGAFESVQYRVLNALIEALRHTYPSLTDAPVVGHSDIAPGRKTDPGSGFDWSRVHAIGATDS
ncbi:MAG: 1,6-anhydro-N-acetylmuramyl-L-alanine amidase AmpD [Pseudomonadota bacterium]